MKELERLGEERRACLMVWEDEGVLVHSLQRPSFSRKTARKSRRSQAEVAMSAGRPFNRTSLLP